MNEKQGIDNRWDKGMWWFILLFSASDFISISVAQIAMAGLIVCWVGRWVSEKKVPDISPLGVPFAVFAMFSIISAVLSLDIIESIKDSKDLLHILIYFAAYDFLRRYPTKTGTVFRVIAMAGGIAALVGMLQVEDRGVDVMNRISGFQNIYMTFAGLLMISTVTAMAVVAVNFRKWKDIWIPASIAIMVFAMLFSLTRNAWIGTMAGAMTLAVLRKPVLAIALPAIVLVILAVSPSNVQDRVGSIFNPQDSTNKERLLLWKAGAKIVADYPLFGVGQNSFPLVYKKYRSPDVLEPHISHLHNNFLEIAVERGVLGLISWTTIFVMALWVMLKAWRRQKEDPETKMSITAGAGGILAFLTAGFFEYNFGDSEVQMLIYLVMAGGIAAVARKEPSDYGINP